MAPSLKDKSGRLQAFVRKDSDDDGAMVQETQIAPEGPAPTRRELADAARLSMPTALRNAGAALHRSKGNARTHPNSPQRAQQGSGHVPCPPLFSGSQLGDDFMNSRISTPHNEAESSEAGESTPNAKKTNHTRQDDVAAPPPATFRIEENLMMSIVPANQRRVLPQIMDGFRDDEKPSNRRHHISYRPQQKRPSPSTVLLRSELPTREVRVKRLPSSGRNAVYEKRDMTSSSSSVDGAKWREQTNDARQAGTVIELDDELASVSAHEESYPSPKPDIPRVLARRGSPVPANIALQKQPRERKRRRCSADYDDNMLSSMTYADLQSEPFDVDPTKTSSQNGHDTSAKLPLKLEQFRQQGEKEQKHMFEVMSIDDWEASGDWFSEQFTGIMKRLREARIDKRRKIQAFEDEAARREEAVRLRSEAIDRKLMKMKQDGQRVVDDKGT
ncbi:hypothetical protein L249_8890 [Ophiocordyceps polyrhachis-furcata BCC 54312]|uniref:Extracellular mutant protein 11 C-terminal domain-containing protein n=1 Tax=Ophiocordyceps polyrhachis-furcata BCC 54312 TaxID=1330021 RepID=A0A367L1S9_9HYPO|nr:hypothetical protein L249_8890 [Ophiocordyceps polyrhachis-furcata BCC 54312]